MFEGGGPNNNFTDQSTKMSCEYLNESCCSKLNQWNKGKKAGVKRTIHAISV